MFQPEKKVAVPVPPAIPLLTTPMTLPVSLNTGPPLMPPGHSAATLITGQGRPRAPSAGSTSVISPKDPYRYWEIGRSSRPSSSRFGKPSASTRPPRTGRHRRRSSAQYGVPTEHGGAGRLLNTTSSPSSRPPGASTPPAPPPPTPPTPHPHPPP